jgi:apolipoprotein N-acyltransferase
VAAVIGLVPALGESTFFGGVLFASFGATAAAAIVASRFTAAGARKRWAGISLAILLLSFISPLALGAGNLPISPFNPADTTYNEFRGGFGIAYSILHVTTYLAVQRFIGREIPN